jgi:hypothetical protein
MGGDSNNEPEDSNNEAADSNKHLENPPEYRQQA